MAENNNGGWVVDNNRVIIDGDQENTAPVNRDNLVLHRINDNGTIGEMVDTINENFKSIAMHGGGPAGIDGINGFDGTDGTNVEYIYALSDEMIAGVHYPTDSTTLRTMFDKADSYGVYKYNDLDWFDHAQPISKEHKNEYVFSRFRRTNDDSSPWYYSEEPVLWAHWGETGKDGDGVEYIFRIYDHELTDDECRNAFSYMDSMDSEMKAIYNIDDFFPGTTWFTAANKTKAEKALKAAGIYNASTFDSRWTAKFGFCDNGSWTDDPSGTGYGKPYEYVSIRRSNTEEETDKKEWTKYSEPALWSKYSFEGRIFIIYANLPNDQKPTSENGLAPKKGDGWWDVTNDKLIFSPTNGSGRIPSIWTDDNLDTPDNYFAWMCSGIFDHTGKNVSWSNPTCISGKDGQPGEDGTNIEFIYTLSVDMPDYPNPITNKSAANNLFDSVEGSTRNVEGYKSSMYEGTEWFDNALPISPEEPTEYVWTRTKEGEDDNGNPIWAYLPHPVIWAHWGEDGTDGDGVEYIFHLSSSETFDDASEPVKLEVMDKYQKIVYNINDFYPGDDWFDKVVDGELVNKKKAIEAVTKAAQFDPSIDVLYFESQWNNIKNSLDRGWTDNPQGTGPMMPYEFVSIRRCDPDASVRTWSDFSEPALWSYYGKATRMFVVYCNMEPNVTPATPSGGYWNVGGSPELTMSRSDESSYKCNALNNGYPDGSSNPSDWTSHKGYWEDSNDDFDDMITWSSSAVFAEDGTIVVPWSKPHRLTGAPGKPGEDGADIEFIYAVEPTMERGRNYPNVIRKASESDSTYTWEDLFNDVEEAENTPKSVSFSGTGGAVTIWYDNAQAIDKAHKTVFAWSRHRDHGLDKPWEYDPEPFVWSHWGEDGKDGDGVEYIFLSADHNTIQDDELPVKGSELTPGTVKKVIYNMDDFYPGPGWFTDGTNNTKNHKEEARVALQLEDLYDSTTFESDWENHFGFTFPEGDNGSHWTDNPSGVSPDARFEFVSIRKSDYDSNGNKVWGDFSSPVIWSSYGKSTRTFIVYCNTVKDVAPVSGTPSKPTGGWWNSAGNALVSSEENPVPYEKDILSVSEREAISNHSVYGAYESNIGFWYDDDIDVPNTIVWISTGTFDESGDNLSWSEPHRITGPDGKKGADGTDIQFIYALTDNPHYPAKNSSTYTRNDLFEDVENPTSDHAINAQAAGYITIGTDPDDNEVKYIEYPATDGTKWYDRARIISRVNKIEYCASRYLPSGSDVWIPDNAPFVWAHWGEDGTDGDGIEYIFMTCEEPFSVSVSTWKNKASLDALSTYHYGIYSIDDLIPNTAWFSDENKAFYKPTVQKYVVAEGNIFNDSDYNDAWNDMKGFFGFDSQIHGLGVWYDNPQDLTPEYPYQYVSVRKSPDGVWGEFSYPTLWSKYNITQFKSMVFTKAKVGIKLSDMHPSGGKFITPTPDPTTYGGIQYTWYDGPQATDDDEVIWMTSATFREDYPNAPYKPWSSPQKMSDRTDFQVEWSESDLTVNEVTILNNMLNSSEYNFGTFLQGHTESEAEVSWRAKVKTDTIANPNISVGVDFDDDPGQAVLMATCQLTNGTWSNWKVVRVKGEQGEPGTSIKVKDRIDHEVYLADGTTYNWENVQEALVNPTLKRTPVEGDFLIVYPHDVTEDGIYYGDTSDSRGGALYMFKYVNGSWTDYSNYDGNTPNGETNGNSYSSPNKHLILWDGDSWQDLGELTGPEGPEGKSWAVYTRYADDDFSQTAKACHKKFVSNENIPTAKWVGFLTYEIISGIDPETAYDEDDYIWSLFKGQDGYGYEYIFWANNENVAPPVPITTDAEDAIDDFEPNVDGYQWVDDPIEPTPSNRYVWMCWRKHDGANNNWGKFRGANGDLSTETGAKARLWQVYANSIVKVEEYFHADESISPEHLFSAAQLIYQDENNNYVTINFDEYWHLKKDVIGDRANPDWKWTDTRKYLFNVEIITYSDGTKAYLAPHFISAWATGVKDVIDYYILESATNNNNDPGDSLPIAVFTDLTEGASHGYNNYKNYHSTTLVPRIDDENYKYDDGTRIISDAWFNGKDPGKDYWVQSVPKMDTDFPVLWNVSYKIYDDDKWDWSTPIVIGVYGEGKQGEDSVYIDLDNEMDSIQIDEQKKILVGGSFETTATLYQGYELMTIHDIDISGEEQVGTKYYLTYLTKYGDTFRPLVEPLEFNYNSTTEEFDLNENQTDILADPSNQYYNSVHCVKITFVVEKDKTLSSESAKVVIGLGHKVSNNINIYRKTSYTFIGTTHPSVYSIVPSTTEILFMQPSNAAPSFEPENITIDVIEKTGTTITTHSAYDSSQKFGLYYTWYRSDGSTLKTQTQIVSTTRFNVSTSGLAITPGCYLTLVVKVDTDDNGTLETVLDRETIFVLREGKDGTSGNGYQYYYGRYVNDDRDSYGANPVTIADTSASTPVFTINGVSLDMSSEPRGGDSDHQYEYRSERSGFGTSWSPWSTPITVARYLNSEDMEGTIQGIVDTATGNMRNEIMSDLSSTISRASYLSRYISESGKFSGTFTDGVKSGLVTAVTTSDAFGNAVTSKLNGFITGDSGATTFADWIDNTNGNIATAQTQLSAMSDYASLRETVTVLSGDVASHTEQISNVTSGYAELTQQVANVQYLKDEEGYFIVEENGTRRRAKKSNGSDASIYSEISSSDVSKLVSVAKELATISETVSNGVAAIDIVAGVGDNSAAAIFEATEDGSSIALKADDVAIKSQYFNLNSSGLSLTGAITATQLTIAGSTLSNASDVSEWINSFVSISGSGGDYSWITRAFSSTNISGGLIQTGNLLAKDSNNKITAGVMGYNTSASNDIRFFAGTTVSASATGTSIISAAQSAPFRVDESGNMYATKGQIAGMSVSASGLQLGDNIFIGNDSEYGDCIKISDYDGNVNILNANGLKIGGSFAAKTAFVVCDLMDLNNTDEMNTLKKQYGIVSSYDITSAFMNYDIIAPISCGNLTIPSYQYFIGRKITIICGHPLLEDIRTIVSNSDLSYSIDMGVHSSNCTFKFANEGICKFYENGGTSNTLKLQNEAVDIIGLGLGADFKGFLVSKRYDITTEYEYGQHCKCLGMYNMTGTTVNTYMSYNGTGPLSVTSSTSSSTNDTVTIVTPYVISSSQLPYIVVSVVPSGGLYYYQIQTSLDSTTSTLKIIIKSNTSISSQPYKVMIFNFGDFSSLSLDSKMPGLINKYEYRYGTSGNWYTLSGNCTFNWNDTSRDYLRLTVSPNVKKVDVVLDNWGSAQSFYYYNTSGTSLQPGTSVSYTASSTVVNIGSVCPKGYNNDDTNNIAHLSITLHTSSITGDIADVTKVYQLVLDQSGVPDTDPTY